MMSFETTTQRISAHISPIWKPDQGFHFGSIDFHFGSIDFHFNWILFPFWKWYPLDLEMVSTWFGNGIHLIWKWFLLDLDTVSNQFGNLSHFTKCLKIFNWIVFPFGEIWFPFYGGSFYFSWIPFPFFGNRFKISWVPFPNQLDTISKKWK